MMPHKIARTGTNGASYVRDGTKSVRNGINDPSQKCKRDGTDNAPKYNRSKETTRMNIGQTDRLEGVVCPAAAQV